MRLVLASWIVAVASANCVSDYTCCAEFDFFIPILQTCVENEPTGADNCARNGQGKVPAVDRFMNKDWILHGVCPDKSPIVTRAQLEAREKKEHEFEVNYKKYCVQNEAHCST